MTWVICAGMIRSGSTLQYQLASRIIERSGAGERIGYVPETDFEKIYSGVTDPAGLKIFKAHVCTGRLYDIAKSGEAAVIYSHRDIRDVAVSAIKKFDKTFVELVSDGWLDQAVEDYRQWTSMPNVMISKYEDLKSDILNEAQRINTFLGNLVDDSSLQELASSYDVDSQVARIEKFRASLGREVKASEIVFDPVEQLHHNHIHDGIIGKWRERLTPAQINFLDCRFGEWLIETGYFTNGGQCSQRAKTEFSIDVAELSEYWKASATSDKNRIEKLQTLVTEKNQIISDMSTWCEQSDARLAAEREKSSQFREWAKNSEQLLAAEKQLSAELRTWSEDAEAHLADALQTNNECRDWAERTEQLLKDEKVRSSLLVVESERVRTLLQEEQQLSVELRTWAENAETRLASALQASDECRGWAERTEQLLKEERARSAQVVAESERTSKLLQEAQQLSAELRTWAENAEMRLAGALQASDECRGWAERTEQLLKDERTRSTEFRVEIAQLVDKVGYESAISVERQQIIQNLENNLDILRLEIRPLKAFAVQFNWLYKIHNKRKGRV